MGCRGCLIFLAVLFLVAAILVGGAGYLLTRPPSIVAAMPILIASEEASADFDRKLEAFLADLGSSRGSGQEATLVISEEEATSKLAQFLRGAQLGIEVVNPQVHFHNGRIQVSAGMGPKWATASLAAEVQVQFRDGKLALVVEKVSFGRFGVPQPVYEQMIESFTRGAGTVNLEDLPIEIGSIEVADGQLVLRARNCPRNGQRESCSLTSTSIYASIIVEGRQPRGDTRGLVADWDRILAEFPMRGTGDPNTQWGEFPQRRDRATLSARTRQLTS